MKTLLKTNSKLYKALAVPSLSYMALKAGLQLNNSSNTSKNKSHVINGGLEENTAPKSERDISQELHILSLVLRVKEYQQNHLEYILRMLTNQIPLPEGRRESQTSATKELEGSIYLI
jgi:hypothetical protein